MSRGRKRPEAVKAAVMAALKLGHSPERAAAEFTIPIGTVKSWMAAAGLRAAVQPQKPDNQNLGDLLVEYAREILTTLRAQVEHARNPDWLQQQNARDLAILHGVLADKTLRLLEAYGHGESDGAGAPAPGGAAPAAQARSVKTERSKQDRRFCEVVRVCFRRRRDRPREAWCT